MGRTNSHAIHFTEPPLYPVEKFADALREIAFFAFQFVSIALKMGKVLNLPREFKFAHLRWGE